MNLTEAEKGEKRKIFEQRETDRMASYLTRLTTSHFESLAVIGKGAFGEVRLVRRKSDGKVYVPQQDVVAVVPVMLLALALAVLRHRTIFLFVLGRTCSIELVRCGSVTPTLNHTYLTCAARCSLQSVALSF